MGAVHRHNTKTEELIMTNTEKKPEIQNSATSAELTQTELDKVAGGGKASPQRVSSESITVQKSTDQSSAPLLTK